MTPETPAIAVPSVKPRRSNKSPAVKASVVAKRVSGESITQIARDLDITRPTVYAILNETNIDAMLKNQAIESANLIPEALRVARVRLAKDSETMAIETLKNTIWPLQEKPHGKQMAGDVTLNQTLNVLLSDSHTDKQ
jgi:transposase-like protein